MNNRLFYGTMLVMLACSLYVVAAITAGNPVVLLISNLLMFVGLLLFGHGIIHGVKQALNSPSQDEAQTESTDENASSN